MTTTVPQPHDSKLPCAPWCSPSEHYDDPADGPSSCYNTPLRLDFGDRGPREDAVSEAVFSLQRHKGTDLLTVMAGFGMSLDPDQIKPIAMAMLATDALLKGDLDLAHYYETQAHAGTAETAGT